MSVVSTHFIKWPIGKFHETAARNGPDKFLPSNVFEVGALKFQMRFHPTNRCRGFSEHHSSIYLSVLNLKDGENFAMQYKLWIENADGLVLKKFDLEDTFKKSKECYGVAEFAQHDHLYSPESQFVKNDIIFVCCEICDIKFEPATPTTPTATHQPRIRFNIPPKSKEPGECTLQVDDKEFNSRRIHYLRLDDIDEKFGTERAEQLMREYAYIAVQLDSLCYDLEFMTFFTDSSGNDTDTSNATSKETNDLELEFNENAGPIGINLELLGKNNLDSLDKANRTEDPEINNILRQFENMSRSGVKPFASSFITPLLKKVKYDPRTPPAVSENHTVVVRVGIHVQSVSNFELTSMDYDMDMWLRLAWRDPRLAHGLSAPVLFVEESYLRRLWRPDAVFINSMESLFHRVTFLNFYLIVFPEGEVFFEARVYLKPKSQLILCHYPHDFQTLILRISSIAMTNQNLIFKWFSTKRDAIRVNRNLQLPEFRVIGYDSTHCDARRKTGNFTCLEARFQIKRNIGFHLTKTYIPTSTCVLFSWISVWLPEEFVEGRIFVALTVFLTLSAESNSAKENLPKVSYIKAIDIWFGFTAVFIFGTMLQAITVIRLEYLSKEKKKIVEKHGADIGVDKSLRMLLESQRLHKLGRFLDEFFKVLYPVIFIIFLIIYAFVVIQGEPTCV